MPPEPAAPAAPAAPVTMTPTSDEPSGDMFSDATSYHDFQSQVKERAKQQRQGAKQPPPKAPLTAAKPAQAAPPPPPPAEMRPTAAESTETMLPPPAAPQTPPVEEPTPETTPAEPTETPPADPTQEAQEAAEQEALGKIREWMRTGGKVPAELADVPIELPNGHHEPFSEVIKGFMRQDDHTSGWQEMEAIKQRSQAAVQAYETHFNQIEDPDPMKGGEAMYEVYTRGPRRAAFMQAARKLALDEQEDITHANGYAIAFAQRERLINPQTGEPLWNHRDVSKAYDDAIKERERIRFDRDMGRQRDWELQRERDQNKQYQSAKKQVEVNKTIENQIAQMRPRAFRQLNVADDAETQVLFRKKLAARAEQVGANVLTPELVMEAARMTRDHLERERGNGHGNGNGKPAQRTHQPQLGGGGGKMGGSQKQEPLTDEEFAMKFKLRKL